MTFINWGVLGGIHARMRWVGRWVVCYTVQNVMVVSERGVNHQIRRRRERSAGFPNLWGFVVVLRLARVGATLSPGKPSLTRDKNNRYTTTHKFVGITRRAPGDTRSNAARWVAVYSHHHHTTLTRAFTRLFHRSPPVKKHNT